MREALGTLLYWRKALGLAAAVCLALALPARGEDLPRVLSLDYCADQYVLALADRAQIVALSRGADDNYSFYRDRAASIRRIAGTTDQILVLAPEVVFQTWAAHPRLGRFAEQQGIQVVQTAYGNEPEVVWQNMRMAGAALGQSPRAEAFVSRYRARLAALEVEEPLALSAAYITPSGFTSGTGTYVDANMRLAGLSSWAEMQNLEGWQPLPLEGLVQNPPDIYVASFFDTTEAHQSNWSVARHSRLAMMMDQAIVADLPGRLLSCDGMFLVEAAELIRQQTEDALEPTGMAHTTHEAARP